LTVLTNVIFLVSPIMFIYPSFRTTDINKLLGSIILMKLLYYKR